MGPAGAGPPTDPNDVGAWLTQAHASGFSQVWVGPEVGRIVGLPEQLERPTQADVAPHRVGTPHPWIHAMAAAGWTPQTEPAGLNGWVGLRRGDAWLDVVLPHYDERNPFRDATSVNQLLSALQLFATAIGRRYRRSPGATGLALMKATGAFTGAEGPPPPPALLPGSVDANPEWLGELPATGWLHGFDINGMFLAAASSQRLGQGQPIHHVGPPDGFGPGTVGSWPGYWLARVRLEGRALPFRADGKPHWYPTPALELLDSLGAPIEVLEVWSYPGARRALTSWYELLRDARMRFMTQHAPTDGAARLALAAVKATYAQSLGWLAGPWSAGQQTYRPDWRQFVIARARANMYRHLHRIHLATGVWPLLIRADQVVYWSDSPSYLATAAKLELTLGHQLGKWKWVGTSRAARLEQLRFGARTPTRFASAVLDELGQENEA